MKKFATFYGTEGLIKDITPDKTLKLELMQALVNGYVEMVDFPDGTLLIGNEEARLLDLPINSEATKIWLEHFPPEKYPVNNAGDWRGNAIHCSPDCLSGD